MREKIENKINECIEAIISKDPKDITYNEYRILDSKLSTLKWEEEQKSKNKEMAEILAKTFSTNAIGFGSAAYALPDPVKED